MKRNGNVAYTCKYHVVWCPKYRRKVLSEEVAVRLKAIVAEVAQEAASDILELEVMPDHVHLLCEADPQFGIARSVATVGGAPLAVIKRYIEEQKNR